MTPHPDYRTIWPNGDTKKKCTICHRYNAGIFVSFRYRPQGEPRQYYLCGRCFLVNFTHAAMAHQVGGLVIDVETYLSTPDDPYRVIEREQDVKRERWQN